MPSDLEFPLTSTILPIFFDAADLPGRNLQMTGDPHYQPADLKPYLGYDQRVGWQIIVELAWLHALIKKGVPTEEESEEIKKAISNEILLKKLFGEITTTEVTKLERKPEVGHDIIALLMMMRERLPKAVHKYLHWCLTSYDTISTAFALQAKCVFQWMFYNKAQEVDVLWRAAIEKYAETVQIQRTHLQHALPGTIGSWLSVPYSRFADAVFEAYEDAALIPGKFSGAVGLYNALSLFGPGVDLEGAALEALGLRGLAVATQLPLPENMERFYNEVMLISAALAQLGEDVRHLQSSDIGEVTSASSTSSTMSHKETNPIAAENMAGMHVSVRTAFMKVVETLNSDLQRDLRYSNVMRGYTEIIVYTYQQLLTAVRLFKSFAVNERRCKENFARNGDLVVAELLHLYLQQAGYPDAHAFVNKTIVPLARHLSMTLDQAMQIHLDGSSDEDLKRIWDAVPPPILYTLKHPHEYIGRAVRIAHAIAANGIS